ncbi:nitrile hydratase subunit alpha [Rhizobium johnstonii]|uniref:nitrile hydratase subunit alpha n=1 Tax=Rhizobium johnstonii TaxID=3019933 RepID=UPI003F967162
MRLKALETVLTEKGFLGADAVDTWLDNYSENVGPMNGAKVIAHAWTDQAFADRLAENAISACFAGRSSERRHTTASNDLRKGKNLGRE